MRNTYLQIKCFYLIIFVIFFNISFSQTNTFQIGVLAPPSMKANFRAVPADYNNDGYADMSVKTSGGYWLIDYADSNPNSPNNGFGSWDASYPEYGGDDAIPVPGDYDGDGKLDLAVKTDSGLWLIDYAIDGFGGWAPLINFNYGGSDAIPVPGYYDDDDMTDIAVKTDSGQWRIDLAYNGFGSWDIDLTQYGGHEARPVPADYNNDGITDLAVKRDNGEWLIDYAVISAPNSGFGGWEEIISTNWLADTIPVPADYDGDGFADIAVKEGEKWKIDYAGDGFGNFIQIYDQYGGADYYPVPADYDHDNKSDLSVISLSTGSWLVDESITGLGGWDYNLLLGNYTDYNYLLGPTLSYYYNDLIKFQKVKDAYVDFLVAPDIMFSSNNYAKIYAYLELAKKSSLKVFLSGYNIASYQNPDGLPAYKQELLSRFKNDLPTGLDQAVMGIFLGDEPRVVDYDNVKKWTDFFKLNFPENQLYYNLFPRYWDVPQNDAEYENYLNTYINANETDFVSFDHYPLKNNEPFKTDFFYNMKVFKDNLGNNRPFWFVVQSHNGIFGNFTTAPYEPKLKFITSSAIAYGAKGLVYWSYVNGIDEYPSTYSSVQKVNRYLKEVIGPVIMTSEHIATLHKSDTYMNLGRPFGSDELVASNNTGVIKDVNNDNILLSLYQKAGAISTDTEYYIWVVNKDITTSAFSTTLSFGGQYFRSYISPRVDSYISPNNSFGTIPKLFNTVTNTTTITIPELLPGEGVMLKLIKRDLIPLENEILSKTMNKAEAKNLKDESLTDLSFKIYPNPAGDFINIQTNDEITSISVYSNSGQKIINFEKNVKQLDIRNIPSGAYILEIKTKNKTRTENFIKK